MDFELKGVLEQPVFRVLDLDLNVLLDARIDMRLHMLNRLVSLIGLPLPVRQLQLLIKRAVFTTAWLLVGVIVTNHFVNLCLFVD